MPFTRRLAEIGADGDSRVVTDDEARTLYVPPAVDSDEPLDETEAALVRALARIIVRKIREEATTRANEPGSPPP